VQYNLKLLQYLDGIKGPVELPVIRTRTVNIQQLQPNTAYTFETNTNQKIQVIFKPEVLNEQRVNRFEFEALLNAMLEKGFVGKNQFGARGIVKMDKKDTQYQRDSHEYKIKNPGTDLRILGHKIEDTVPLYIFTEIGYHKDATY